MKEMSQYIRLLMYLNIADCAFTYAGIVTRNIGEQNPIMEDIIHQPILLLLVKLVLPTVFFIILNNAVETERYKPGMIVSSAIKLGTYAYTAVLYLHAYWIVKAVMKFGNILAAFSR